MSAHSALHYAQDNDGIVILTMDAPGASANTMNGAFRASLQQAMDRLEREKESISGVVVTSAKRTFSAGGDLHELSALRRDQAGDLYELAKTTNRLLRRLETLDRPVVAALNGSALGGGLEIALACHRRIAVSSDTSIFGLPEVTLGLMPGAGGVVRSVRLLGVDRALTDLLLKGQRYSAAQAVDVGIVDEIVPDPGLLIARAKDWIGANPQAKQPWDDDGYRIPGGTPVDGAFAAKLPSYPALLRRQVPSTADRAPMNILAAAVEGTQVDIDAALRIESRYFVEIALGQVAKNRMHFFSDSASIRKRRRTAGGESWRAKSVAVLGSGMMGAGIAYACARAGVDVVVKDVTLDLSERSRTYAGKMLDRMIEKGTATVADRDEVLARIKPTERATDCSHADLVVEAVFESVDLKREVFAELEPLVSSNVLLGSNTSTLPIVDLARDLVNPERFIGLHFFSPVDRMPLLEIVVGRQTSDATLNQALDFAFQLDMTPIVVRDSRGFFTSRVFSTFFKEGLAMLGEGVDAQTLERATTAAGFPVGVLQVLDEINLELVRKVRRESMIAAQSEGTAYESHPADPVIDKMLALNRPGRKAGKGFYDYDDNGARDQLWAGLREHFPPVDVAVAFDEIQERLLIVEALESVRCLEEGVIGCVADANVASVVGIGYPAWTGGVLQYIDSYPGGATAFIQRADVLARQYGRRFVPPELLREMAETGRDFG